LLLGLGLGWNRDESADHGVEATMRGKLLDEKLAAVKQLRANDEAEFDGHHVDFDATYCSPKPVQKRYIVACNMSYMQPSLRKGLASNIPFIKILRGLKRL